MPGVKTVQHKYKRSRQNKQQENTKQHIGRYAAAIVSCHIRHPAIFKNLFSPADLVFEHGQSFLQLFVGVFILLWLSADLDIGFQPLVVNYHT